MKLFWVLAAGAAAFAVAKMQSKPSDSNMRELVEKGYAFGLREPGELAVYVAGYLWPEDAWPPAYGDPQEKEARYADVWVAVTSYLAEADGFRG